MLLMCWLCSQISMSVQQENTTAAMRPCATTPLAHITALVGKDMLETVEIAQVRHRSECLSIPSFKTVTVELIPSSLAGKGGRAEGAVLPARRSAPEHDPCMTSEHSATA